MIVTVIVIVIVIATAGCSESESASGEEVGSAVIGLHSIVCRLCLRCIELQCVETNQPLPPPDLHHCPLPS